MVTSPKTRTICKPLFVSVMFTEYFPCCTFHCLSSAEQIRYAQDGFLTVRSLNAGADIGYVKVNKKSQRQQIIERDHDIYQPMVRRNPIAPRRSYDLKKMLRCIEVVEEVLTEDGTMFTMLTEFAGVVDVEVLSTRYVLHFDSAHRHYIMDKLSEYQIPHTRNVDGHTTEILRMEKQKKVGMPWWKK